VIMVSGLSWSMHAVLGSQVSGFIGIPFSCEGTVVHWQVVMDIVPLKLRTHFSKCSF